MKKALVGMSGGVDSSAAALLLLEQGYEVAGATFALWSEGDSNGQDIKDARSVCDALGIKHYVFDYKELFCQRVVESFALAYRQGKTPNPCVECNRHIKFGAFWEDAQALGFNYIATGHYARVEPSRENKGYRLRKGADLKKDQSYVLYNLNQKLLDHLLLPLGEYSKEDIRDITGRSGLKVSQKKDSQDICFVPDGDYAGFLTRYTGLSCPEGDFIDSQENILGRHKGIWKYTIGQRKGLGVSFGQPMFVTGIDSNTNKVRLGENGELFSNSLVAVDFNWVEPLREDMSLTAKIRYSQQPSPVEIDMSDQGKIIVSFTTPQRAITPGQSAVVYDGEYLVGGGVILK